MSGRARFAARAALALVLSTAGATASAQDATAPEAPITPQTEMLLRGRIRSLIHPSEEPLKVSGIESEGNDMRRSTPALRKARASEATVDVDVQYERAIAMMSGRAVFTTPPPRIAPTVEVARGSADDETGAASDDSAPGDEPPGTDKSWVLCGAAGALVAGFGWLLVRGRG